MERNTLAAKVLLTQGRRRKVRKLAREAWIFGKGDTGLAEQYVRDNLSQVGSFLTLLMITSAVIQICYTAWKIWREMNVATPCKLPVPGEPFGIEES